MGLEGEPEPATVSATPPVVSMKVPPLAVDISFPFESVTMPAPLVLFMGGLNVMPALVVTEASVSSTEIV
jgi:hypothetical protein